MITHYRSRFCGLLSITLVVISAATLAALSGICQSNAPNAELFRNFITNPPVAFSLRFSVRDFDENNVDEYLVRWQTNAYYIEITNSLNGKLVRPWNSRRVAGFDGTDMWIEDEGLIHVLPLTRTQGIIDPYGIREKIANSYLAEVLRVLGLGIPYQRVGKIEWETNRFRFVNRSTVVRGQFFADDEGTWQGFDLTSLYGGEEYKARVKYRYAYPPLLGFLPTSWDVYLPRRGKAMEIAKTYEIKSFVLTNGFLPRDSFTYSNRLGNDISGVVRYGPDGQSFLRHEGFREKRREILGVAISPRGVRLCFYLGTAFLGLASHWAYKRLRRRKLAKVGPAEIRSVA